MSVVSPPRNRAGSTRSRRPQPETSPVARASRGVQAWAGQVGHAFNTPTASYYTILGCTLTLTVLGLVMVLSSSFVDAMAAGESPFAVFLRQAVYAVVGIPLMLVIARTRAQHVRRSAWWLLIAAALVECLVFVPGLGVRINGNMNWIRIGPVQAQPSEGVKLALILWVAAVLAAKGRLVRQWRHALFPVAVGAGLVFGLVLYGHDMGTTIVLVTIVAAMLFVAGAPVRIFVAGFAAAVLAGVPLVMSSASRMRRVAAFAGGGCDSSDVCYQSLHGKYALATGGITGVNLGQSREKWSYLPEAHNDFIFAVIGEELGLVGTVLLVLLFAVLTLALLRVIRRHESPFIKIATAGILAWVAGQAVINIAVVLGLLPVLGVPLPFVSSGGSALLACLAAMGLALSFARQEPGAAEALAARASARPRLFRGRRPSVRRKKKK